MEIQNAKKKSKKIFILAIKKKIMSMCMPNGDILLNLEIKNDEVTIIKT